MKTLSLSMPDDPAAVPGWLERQLVGPNLPQLVAELAVFHGEGTARDLNSVLGDSRNTLLASGFAHVPRRVLKTLLTSPTLLFELQAEVMEFGGAHWDRLMGGTGPLAEPRRAVRSLGWLRTVGLMAATAAAVLVAVYLGGGFQRPPASGSDPGWGFAKVQQLPRDGGSKAVFPKLAELADEWGNKPTDDRVALAKRFTEFLFGCSALQAADLNLPPQESAWLKDRLLVWSDEMSGHLRDLDTTGDVLAVRAAADRTVAKISAELRQRAI